MNITPDVTTVVLIGALLEFAKIYIEDKVEPKLLPIIAIVLGALLGYFNLGNIVVGITSGLTASGVYKFSTKVADKVGGNGA